MSHQTDFFCSPSENDNVDYLANEIAFEWNWRMLQSLGLKSWGSARIVSLSMTAQAQSQPNQSVRITYSADQRITETSTNSQKIKRIANTSIRDSGHFRFLVEDSLLNQLFDSNCWSDDVISVIYKFYKLSYHENAVPWTKNVSHAWSDEPLRLENIWKVNIIVHVMEQPQNPLVYGQFSCGALYRSNI